MMDEATEALAGLNDDLHSDTENCSDQPTPPKGRCEACGFRHFDLHRVVRRRAQWECVECGGITEIPAEGEQ